MPNANNQYLFAAYAAVWIIFMIYAWSIARRETKLRRDIEDLKERVALGERRGGQA